MSYRSPGVQFAFLLAGAAFLAGLQSYNPAVQAAAPDQVIICHATGSNNNPYVQIPVNDDAVDGNGNDNADHNRPGHQNGEDIIPPGPWDIDGRNWDAQGQAIWNNQCNIPTPTPTPTPTASPTPSTTPTPTPTPSTSPSPSATPSPTPSSSPTPSASPTPTPTASPTPSTTPTPTPTPSTSPTPSATPSPTPTPELTGVGGEGDEADCCPGPDPEQVTPVVVGSGGQPRIAGITTSAKEGIAEFPSAGPLFATHFVQALAFLTVGWAARRVS